MPWPDLTHASLEARRVHDALAELSVVQREALELAYFGGYTHIATRLGVPLGTAKTRTRRRGPGARRSRSAGSGAAEDGSALRAGRGLDGHDVSHHVEDVLERQR